MNERLKLLRKNLNMTQDEFGKKIGLARNSIANYEIGRREPTNSVIVSICREFNVNEEWLRTGVGEMFKVVPEEDEVAMYVADLLEEDENPFFDIIIDLMKTYNELDEKSQKVIKEFAKKFAKNTSKRKEG